MLGHTLSHYEITAKLGEGGMGEVWRATDTKLNRDVAVKVLPEEMAGDPDRLERFKREAQAIAALRILLYEMACGRRPFRGDNPASVISAVLKDHPPLVTEVKADLPNHFGRIVRRCLEKDPDLRYQSAKNLHHELEALSPPPRADSR